MIVLFRRLLGWLVVVGVSWILGRLLGRAVRAQSREGAGRGAVRRTDGAMVRDRVCNTFLPRSRALKVERGGREHFFCSEGCRRSFLTQPDQDRASA